MPRGGWGAAVAPRSNVRKAAPAHPSQWTTSAPLNKPRAAHGGGERGGAIFVLGGWPDSKFSRALKTAEYLDKIGNPWQEGPRLNDGRGNPAAAALNDRLCAIGGYPKKPRKALTSVEVLECGKGTAWSRVRPLPDLKGRGSGAAAAAGDRIYVTGGDDGTTAPSLGALLIYDPKTDQYGSGAPMPTPRSNLKLVHLNGSIYAIGGIANGNPTGPALRTVERYDPAQDHWAPVASMNTPRVNPAIAVVGDQIVVIGGARAELRSSAPAGHRRGLLPGEGRVGEV